MSDLNKMITDANMMRKKVLNDLSEFVRLYMSIEREVTDRFQDEIRHNNNNLTGLADFHQLFYACKKNCTTAKSIHNLVSRISDLSGFDIKEEDELIKQLDKIFKE